MCTSQTVNETRGRGNMFLPLRSSHPAKHQHHKFVRKNHSLISSRMPKKWTEDTRGIKAKAQKAEATEAKGSKAAAARKKREDEEWTSGTNKRAMAKSATASDKAAAKAAAILAKREQEAKEAAEMGAGGKAASRGKAKVAARR